MSGGALLRCAGCGAVAAGEAPPFRCPHADAGDGIDHLMTRVLEPDATFPGGDEPNPFVRYRGLLHAHALAVRDGMSDGAFVALVERLDRAVAAVDGRGFGVTPLAPAPALGARLGLDAARGALWVKDETGGVAGSHKARHLFGILVYLEVAEALGRLPRAAREAPLAIASCGNAALAAAVVARAARRTLEVFVPPTADPAVLRRLAELGARLTFCPRAAGVAGDPCYHLFRRRVAEGALPFSCQGTDNGLTLDGGRTLGYEMVSSLGRSGRHLDRLLVQVGGGALASATFQAFREAVALGALARLPRLHAVQTRGAWPLARAYDRLMERIVDGLRRESPAEVAAAASPVERAELARRHACGEVVAAALAHATAHRADYMWPWEVEPASIAHGILDDETYDWRAVVEAMIGSGGWPIVVSEEELARAHGLARDHTGIPVDPTGAAGLAGLLALARDTPLRPDEHVAVLFTGAERR